MVTKPPLLLIVTGPPCAGKTTLAIHLAQALHLPLVTKDGIKEILFDSLGWSDRAWSKQLSHAAYQLMFYFIDTQLSAGYPLIVEGNFHSNEATPRFLALQKKHAFTPFQVVCNAALHILFARYQQRAETHLRHPGHLDHLAYTEFHVTSLDSKHYNLAINGVTIHVDTSDPGQIDLAPILESIPPDYLIA